VSVLPPLVADNFEAMTFGSWWTVTTDGDGTATISTAQHQSGTCAGLFTESANPGSLANISNALGGTPKTDVWASGWFYVAQEGAAGGNVPYLRFFDGATRIVGVYRQNGGEAWLLAGATFTNLSTSISLGTWHQVTLHVAPNGATSTVEVWIDSAPKFSTATASLTTTQLTKVQLGNEVPAQQGTEYFDDVTIGAS
jgi:hypothetical protein